MLNDQIKFIYQSYRHKPDLETIQRMLLRSYVTMSDNLLSQQGCLDDQTAKDILQHLSNYRDLLNRSVPFLGNPTIEIHKDKIRQLELFMEVAIVEKWNKHLKN